MKEAFPIREVVQILGVRRETFKTWVHRGYIKPSFYRAKGPGEQSLYDRLDLYAIKLFDQLLNFGFHRLDAKGKIKAFLKAARTRDMSEIGFIAFFKRPIDKKIMRRRSGAYFTNHGQLVSDKAMAPEVRLMSATDLKKSFEILFLNFEDTGIPRDFDINGIDLDYITIVDFSKIRESVDLKIKNLNLT